MVEPDADSSASGATGSSGGNILLHWMRIRPRPADHPSHVLPRPWALQQKLAAQSPESAGRAAAAASLLINGGSRP